ncbi:MAG: DinB family protein [Rhodothermales bacterium]|nr:DinB family protein [Rhodothermales bacterium]
MLAHFERSSFKTVRMADAMPESLYSWTPMEGAMSVARVYAHIARYNYYYLESSLGIPVPDGVDLESMEDLTNKDMILTALRESIAHVKTSVPEMSDEDLGKSVVLYGRSVKGWQVLTQLVSHMNEHVGQAVAYGRMNEVVPPWSR